MTYDLSTAQDQLAAALGNPEESFEKTGQPELESLNLMYGISPQVEADPPLAAAKDYCLGNRNLGRTPLVVMIAVRSFARQQIDGKWEAPTYNPNGEQFQHIKTLANSRSKPAEDNAAFCGFEVLTYVAEDSDGKPVGRFGVIKVQTRQGGFGSQATYPKTRSSFAPFISNKLDKACRLSFAMTEGWKKNWHYPIAVPADVTSIESPDPKKFSEAVALFVGPINEELLAARIEATEPAVER